MRKLLLMLMLTGMMGMAQEYTAISKKVISGKISMMTIDKSGEITKTFSFMPEDYMKVEMKMNKDGNIRPTKIGKVKVTMTDEEYNEIVSLMKRVMEYPLNSSIRMKGPMGFEFYRAARSNAVNMEYGGRYITLYPGDIKKLINK